MTMSSESEVITLIHPDYRRVSTTKMKAATKMRAVLTDEKPREILLAALQEASEEKRQAIIPRLRNMRRAIRRQEAEKTRIVSTKWIRRVRDTRLGRRWPQKNFCTRTPTMMTPVNSCFQQTRTMKGNDLELDL